MNYFIQISKCLVKCFKTFFIDVLKRFFYWRVLKHFFKTGQPRWYVFFSFPFPLTLQKTKSLPTEDYLKYSSLGNFCILSQKFFLKSKRPYN